MQIYYGTSSAWSTSWRTVLLTKCTHEHMYICTCVYALDSCRYLWPHVCNAQSIAVWVEIILLHTWAYIATGSVHWQQNRLIAYITCNWQYFLFVWVWWLLGTCTYIPVYIVDCTEWCPVSRSNSRDIWSSNFHYLGYCTNCGTVFFQQSHHQ